MLFIEPKRQKKLKHITEKGWRILVEKIMENEKSELTMSTTDKNRLISQIYSNKIEFLHDKHTILALFVCVSAHKNIR